MTEKESEVLEDKIAAAILRGLISVFRRLPLSMSGHLGDWGGRLAACLLSEKQRTAYWNMRMALGDHLSTAQIKKELFEQFRHLGRNFAEVLSFEKLTPKQIESSITIHGLEHFEKVVASGKGAVLLTGHYGNWELLQVVAGIRGAPIHVLGRDQRHPLLNEILQRQREIHGSVAVSRGMNVRFLLKALKEGKLVGVLGDQSAGRDGGLLLPFFGRVTTVPTGAFELARRGTGAYVLPCFMLRDQGEHHTIYIEEPLEEKGQTEIEIIQNQAQAYLQLLEKYIKRSPRQWLWQNKRWKYSWTRRIVVLSDKKPGHFKQSQAVAALFSKIRTYHDRPGLTFQNETVDIEYHSPFHKKMLFMWGWIFLPWIRGRFEVLKFFLKEESVLKLMSTQADFIIAAGSGMMPIQHLFAAETGAKKIVMMNPSFPYNQLRYDLALVPAHDVRKVPKNTLRTLFSPSGYGANEFETEAAQLRQEMKEQVDFGVAVFIGGRTREFDWTVADAEKLLSILERFNAKIGGYVLTTSRRTALGVERFLKHRAEQLQGCCKLIIANEDPRSFVVKGMLGLARLILVTEDSLAMISEAVASGKPVVVLCTDTEKLPLKHRRFLKSLVEKNLVTAVQLGDLGRLLAEDWPVANTEAIERETEVLVETLRNLL